MEYMMSNQNKKNTTKKQNTSKIVSLGHTPKNYADSFFKLIADLSGVIDSDQKTKAKFKYD